MAFYHLQDCIINSYFHHGLLDCIKEGMNDEAKSILQDIENPYNSANSFGFTLLHYSAKFSNTVIIQYLVDGGCNINAQDTFGITALMLAVQNKDVMTVEILLKNNADVYVTDQTGKSSLELAFYCRFCRPLRTSSNVSSHLMVEILFNKVNEDFSSDNNKVTQFLLNTNDFVKLAAVVYGNVQLTRFMLENGYNIDYREPELSFTALHCAIVFGRIENCKILIEHGANVNAINKVGFSPLHYYIGNLEYLDKQSIILESLLKRADVTLDQKKFEDLQNLLISGKKETVRTVLQSDVDMDEHLHRNTHLLYLLIENKNVGVIDLFDELNIKFDVNKVTARGSTALMSAALSGSLRKVEFLLSRGADVNITSSKGMSALLYAAKYSCPDTPEHYIDILKITELLLQRGADAQYVCNRTGESFLDSLSIRKDTLQARTVIAHLAMLGALYESPLTDFTRNRIECYPWFKSYFSLCTQQLEQMKRFEVYGTVTLFKLLTERDDKILTYAGNNELISAFETIMEGKPNLESYYSNTLRNRVGNSRHKVEWQQKAVSTFESLSGICSLRYYNIVYQIINYLNLRDLQNLLEAGNIVFTIK